MSLFGKNESDKTLLENLCCLEINTILKENMTGKKMPVPEVALGELAELYGKHLKTVDYTVIGRTTFQALHDAAVSWLKTFDQVADSLRSAEYWLVARIRNNSAQIVAIYNALERRGTAVTPYTQEEATSHPIELLTDELVLLRKAWEIGLEEIVLQTTIQLDGDVVHRVTPRFALQKDSFALEIHNQAVRTSVDYWKTLLELLASLTGGIIRLFGGFR